jgi:hypothetical protein
MTTCTYDKLTDATFNNDLNNADEDLLINMLHDLVVGLRSDREQLADFNAGVRRVEDRIDKNKDRQLKVKEKLLTHLIKYRKYNDVF